MPEDVAMTHLDCLAVDCEYRAEEVRGILTGTRERLAEALKAQENAEARERRIVEECEKWRGELARGRERILALEREVAALRARLPANGAAVPLSATMAKIEERGSGK